MEKLVSGSIRSRAKPVGIFALGRIHEALRYAIPQCSNKLGDLTAEECSRIIVNFEADR